MGLHQKLARVILIHRSYNLMLLSYLTKKESLSLDEGTSRISSGDSSKKKLQFSSPYYDYPYIDTLAPIVVE
jgi:hypothetical protein